MSLQCLPAYLVRYCLQNMHTIEGSASNGCILRDRQDPVLGVLLSRHFLLAA